MDEKVKKLVNKIGYKKVIDSTGLTIGKILSMLGKDWKDVETQLEITKNFLYFNDLNEVLFIEVVRNDGDYIVKPHINPETAANTDSWFDRQFCNMIKKYVPFKVEPSWSKYNPECKIFINSETFKSDEDGEELNEGRVPRSERVELYKDKNIIVVVPLTHRALQKYAHECQWCINSDLDEWEDYHKGKHAVIIQRNPKKPKIGITGNPTASEIFFLAKWDNNQSSFDDVCQILDYEFRNDRTMSDYYVTISNDINNFATDIVYYSPENGIYDQEDNFLWNFNYEITDIPNVTPEVIQIMDDYLLENEEMSLQESIKRVLKEGNIPTETDYLGWFVPKKLYDELETVGIKIPNKESDKVYVAEIHFDTKYVVFEIVDSSEDSSFELVKIGKLPKSILPIIARRLKPEWVDYLQENEEMSLQESIKRVLNEETQRISNEQLIEIFYSRLTKKGKLNFNGIILIPELEDDGQKRIIFNIDNPNDVSYSQAVIENYIDKMFNKFIKIFGLDRFKIQFVLDSYLIVNTPEDFYINKTDYDNIRQSIVNVKKFRIKYFNKKVDLIGDVKLGSDEFWINGDSNEINLTIKARLTNFKLTNNDNQVTELSDDELNDFLNEGSNGEKYINYIQDELYDEAMNYIWNMTTVTDQDNMYINVDLV